jgi:hypothetical protein
MLVVFWCILSWFFLYPEESSDIVEIYRNSEGAFDIVADGPSDVSPRNRMLFGITGIIRVFDIVADGPSDVPPRNRMPFEITGIIRKEGAGSMYLAGIYEAVDDLTL